MKKNTLQSLVCAGLVSFANLSSSDTVPVSISNQKDEIKLTYIVSGPSKTYRVQRTESLIDPTWVDRKVVTGARGPIGTYSESKDLTKGFYRVIEE